MIITESSMSELNKYIAVIPARSGSKRLPGKNLMTIAGKPLIAWTIEAALETGLFDRVIVSTDSSQIAETAMKMGAEVPFLRPPALARDKTTTIDVLIHLVQQLKNESQKGFPFSHLALLQPTSPLRTSNDIISAVEFLEGNEADAVVSICRTEHSPLWSNTLPPDNNLSDFISESTQKTPSQNLPVYYRLNGAIYLCSISRMMDEKTLFLKDKCFGYVMSRKNSIDIDDEIDFELAEIYLKRSKASI